MVIQFKKYLLTLVFTVALCCGLSVSAFASEFRYGGMIGPELPVVDATAYPYHFTYRDSTDDLNTLIFCSVKPVVEIPPSGHSLAVTFDKAVDFYVYDLVDGVWTNGHSESYAAYGWFRYLGVFETFWTNVELIDSSGYLIFPAQSPIPVSDTTILTSSLTRSYFTNTYPYSSSSTLDLSYGAGTSSNLIPVVGGSNVTIAGSISGAYYDVTYFDLAFINSSGLSKIVDGQTLVNGDDWTLSGRQKLGTSVYVPQDTVLIWVNLWKGGQTFTLSNASDIFFGFYSRPVTSTPTIFATTSNITNSTVLLTIDIIGMDSTKTYNVRLDGTSADGEEQSTIIGTITGRESYSISDTLGPFDSDTTYRASLVLLEDGVEVSSDLIEFTTLPVVYDPQITASQYNLTATTMTSQINLSGLDPSATYRVQYSLKESDSGETVASGVSNQIGVVTDVENYTGYSRIIDLKPSTAYQIVWAVTGTSDDVIDYYDFNFTTLSDGSGGGSSGESTLTDSLLLLILNKVTAIFDTISGGESDGILASINEKLDALIDTLANPEEQELEDNFKDSLTEVNDNFFGDDAPGQAVTVSDVGNLADTQGTVKNIFQSEYTVSDFFGIFSDQSLFAWFSADTAMDLNPNAYGGAALADLDDPYNMQDYYDNLEKVRGKK